MRIVCISDTHLVHRRTPFEVPDGDLLLHAGDATSRGSLEEVAEFSAWFSSFSHPHKVFVAGNHDWAFQTDPKMAQACLDDSITYLEDSEAVLGGLKIYGSPWQPEFYNWAFNLPRGEPLREKWRKIPTQVDVLITHGPPYGVGDQVLRGERVGCEDLLAEIDDRVRPRLHVFGHIHEGYGRYSRGDTEHVNASIVDVRYRVSGAAVVVDL